MSELLGFVCGAVAGYVVGMILVGLIAAAAWQNEEHDVDAAG